MRCYVKNMDDFVNKINDPAIRDIHKFAQLVTQNLKLVEGTLEQTPMPESDESINPENTIIKKNSSHPDNNPIILNKTEDSQAVPTNSGESPNALRLSNTLTTPKKSPKSTAKETMRNRKKTRRHKKWTIRT